MKPSWLTSERPAKVREKVRVDGRADSDRDAGGAQSPLGQLTDSDVIGAMVVNPRGMGECRRALPEWKSDGKWRH